MLLQKWYQPILWGNFTEEDRYMSDFLKTSSHFFPHSFTRYFFMFHTKSTIWFYLFSQILICCLIIVWYYLSSICHKVQTGVTFFGISLAFLSWNGILLPKLFWPTGRKNCSSDRENLLKFQTEVSRIWSL